MKKTWKWRLPLLAIFVWAGCEQIEPEPEPQPKPQPEEKILYSLKSLSEMSLREKVGQLFNVRVEALDLTSSYTQTAGSSVLTDGFSRYPCGGVTLFAANIIGLLIQLDTEETQALHNLGADIRIVLSDTGCEHQDIETIHSRSIRTDIFLHAINKHLTRQVRTFIALVDSCLDITAVARHTAHA